MKKILIIGAGSYIGESFETYARDRYDISTLDARGLIPDSWQFQGFDAVFYVVGIAHRKETRKNAHLYYEVNRDLAVETARAARNAGVRHFILMSTMAVYGLDEGRIEKQAKPHPVTHYGRSKLEADRAVWKLRGKDFKIAVLRPPMVYGKGCRGNYQALRRLALKTPVFPDVKNQRSMLYIGNLCEFLVNVIDGEKSGLFFPQNGEYVDTGCLVREIALAHGKKVKVKGFAWIGKLPVRAAKKAFGSLVYEHGDYIGTFGFKESIMQSETGMGKEGSTKPCVAVLTSYTPSLLWYRMDMMRLFVKKGYRVYALGDQPSSRWEDRLGKYGIAYRQVYMQRNGINPLKDLLTIASILKCYMEIKPDRIFTYQAKSTIYGGIAARLMHIKGVFPMIGGIGSVFLSDAVSDRVLRKIVVWEYKMALKNASSVFFQNFDDERTFSRYGIISGRKTVMLHGSGVNIRQFGMMPQPERTSFLLTARLIRDKGIREYLEACRKFKAVHPQGRCMLLGPFDTNPTALKKKELQPFIDEGIIEYFGEQNDVRPFLKQCSVFVLPSYREGTPKAVLEAMACGRAVITTDTSGCRETVRDGENGYLVPVRDSESIYKKMVFLYEHPEIAREMGVRGRKMAEDIFNVDFVNEIICRTMNISEEYCV